VAVDEALRSRGIASKVVDGLDYAPLAFRTWYGGGYEATVRNRPEAWGWLYRISDVPGFAFTVQTWSDHYFLKKLDAQVEDFRPDIVLCTHSLPQPRLARLREKYGFKMAVVVTDLYPHKMWLRGAPDWFFVPQEWSREVLEERMPGAAARTTITGIPVHEVFANVPTMVEARERLKLNLDAPVVFLTAGGIGAGDFPGAAEVLARIPNVQLVVVCGRNDRAYQSMVNRKEAGQFGTAAREVRILKRVPLEDMAGYMVAADVLVGKPGGLTVSEALAVGVPFVVHEPFLIPGQEEDNAKYLVEKGMGIRTANNEELVKVGELLADPLRLNGMRIASKAAGKPHASATIADHLVWLSEQ
jgi:processive 1,2-diacylglycerol beta-glucosyltransferase